MKNVDFFCRAFGHSLHVDASYYYGEDVCVRCGCKYIARRYSAARAKVRVVIAVRSVREWAFNARAFFCRCDECGQRFGRHRADIDHLPF